MNDSHPPQQPGAGTVVVLKQHRKRLPPRCESRTLKFRPNALGNKPALHLTMNYYLDSAQAAERGHMGGPMGLGAVFVSGPLNGSDADSNRKDWAKLLSVALQWGMPLEQYARLVERSPDGKPLSLFGEIVDELMKEQG